MKLSIPLLLIAAATLAACSRPVVRETVVEKPVFVERPAPAAAGATISPNCTWASQSYSNGAMSCQDRVQYRCTSGTWERTLNAC